MPEFHAKSKNGRPGLPWQIDVRKEADRNWLALHNITVKLDGERAIRVIAFDTKAGTLTRYKLTGEGHLMMTPSGKQVATETVKGDVTVEWSA